MDGKNRTELNEYLKSMEFELIGNLVHLPLKSSVVQEVRRSEKSAVVKMSLEVRNDSLVYFDPQGIRLERFRKNSVVLFNHDCAGLPVARSLWERCWGEDGVATFVAKPQFHLDTCLSRDIWLMVESGLDFELELGVIPDEWYLAPGEDYWCVSKWDLLEYSFVFASTSLGKVHHLVKERKVSAPALMKDLELRLDTSDLAQLAQSVEDVAPVQEESCSFLEAVKSDLAYAKKTKLSRAGIFSLLESRVKEHEEKE